MGNIYSIFNFIYNEECIFGRKRKPKKEKSNTKPIIPTDIPMCIVTPLSNVYNINVNDNNNNIFYDIEINDIPPLITENLSISNNNIKV